MNALLQNYTLLLLTLVITENNKDNTYDQRV